MFQLTWRQRGQSDRGQLQLPASSGVTESRVKAVGLTLWEEHCVECAAPQCYRSCSLYVPRADRKCARFVAGISPNPSARGLFRFGAEIRFRRWGKLEAIIAQGLPMYSPTALRVQRGVLDGLEELVSLGARLFQRLSPTRKLNGAFTALKRLCLKWQAALCGRPPGQADYFFLKCWSFQSAPFHLQLEVVTNVCVYRARLPIVPGWNEYLLKAAEMLAGIDRADSRIRFTIEGDEEVHVMFTWLHFVRLGGESTGSVEQSRGEGQPAARVKCVAWDLDNTLWQGVVGDAGVDGVSENPEMLQLIRELDERGILQTIVSKNDYEVAWKKIESLGLQDFFLYPAIHWGPKSGSLQSIADRLNINVDTFAVIDDSEFERSEISTALPQVRVFDPAVGRSLLQDEAFRVPVTDESRARRQMYQTEAARQQIQAGWRGDFEDFLRSCELRLLIRRPGEAEQPRCLELLQRSNQFNLSGRKYDAAAFRKLLLSTEHECWSLEVSDRFGSYGIVGFAAFAMTGQGMLLVDFVLSCRVAQKQVETHFFRWFAARRAAAGEREFRAAWRRTDRNQPLREVLAASGFTVLAAAGDEQVLSYACSGAAGGPSVITVVDGAEEACSVAAGVTGVTGGAVFGKRAS
ncbi:MAG: HAD-IIIC family phosphatase [Planctomycetaceae bacterium]